MGEQDGAAFLVMECLDGETLAERLEEGPLPLDQALRYGMQIADALSVAHQQGVIHRDLKPGNVMLTRHGVKLLDFGLAKLTQADRDPDRAAETESLHLTQEGTLLGTVAHAPEQLEGDEADARTDIFALGAVLYEMATGRRPFAGRSRASLIAAILSSEPPPLATVQPMTPPLLERVVKRCLAKDPDGRWQSARDLASELRWILEGGSEAGVPRPVAARRRGRSLLWGGLIGAALAGAAFAVILSRTGSRQLPSFHQVTFRRGYLDQARFAPDGQTIVYGAAWEGRPLRVFSTRQGSPESRVIGPERSRLVSISRSGEMALIIGGDNRGTLARAPLAGGAPRELLANRLDSEWLQTGRSWRGERRHPRVGWSIPIGKGPRTTPGSERCRSPKGPHRAGRDVILGRGTSW